MSWELTDDPAEAASRVWELLAAEPALNTVALTVLDAVRAGRRWSDDPMVFGWHGRPADGAVLMTPPFELLLAHVPTELLPELVTALRTHAVPVPGVNGEAGTVERFAAAWTADGTVQGTTVRRERLYALTSLVEPSPPGRARPAVDADHDVVVRYVAAFLDETPVHPVDPDQFVRDRIPDRLIWLWEEPTGVIVSLAGRHRPAAGVARVGPVYTPPEHRRHGYGAAVTAAATADALRRDADDVVLFTDLANPTSNAIYQQIGYRPIRDHAVVRFSGGDHQG